MSRRIGIFWGLGPLLLVGWISVGHALTCTLAWDAVTTCTDGSPCVPQGYRLYAKATATATYDMTRPTVEILVSQLADVQRPAITSACMRGQRWIVTAFDADGESATSNEAVVRVLNKAPTNLTVKVFP